MIQNFTAKDANLMYESRRDEKANEILNQIKSVAHESSTLHWYETLDRYTLRSLEERGFHIHSESDREGTCYTISW